MGIDVVIVDAGKPPEMARILDLLAAYTTEERRNPENKVDVHLSPRRIC
jgi:hypothetical protein